MSAAQVDLERFRSDASEPLSFWQRGASVPFTTPVLVNARIRSADFGPFREMVVINPSGGRGFFVLPWSAMPEICAPTLYDRHLWETLSEAEDISPAGIRHEAQRLAAQGLAGRHAAAAARIAQARDQAAQRLLRSTLLDGLISLTETAEEKANGGQLGQAMSPANRGERAILRASVIAEVSLGEFTSDLEALCVALSWVVPETAGEESPLHQVLGGLGRMTQGIARWVKEEEDHGPHEMAARFVYRSARQTMECAEKALAATKRMIVEFGRLVPYWKGEKDKVLEHARIPDWVLDGWRTPLELWEAAGPKERKAALWDVALIAPVLPREAKILLGKTSDWRETPSRLYQTVHDRADWRSGAPLDLEARTTKTVSETVSFENQVLPMRMSAPQNILPALQERMRAKRDKKAAHGMRESLNPEDIGSIAGIVQQTGSPGALEALGGVGELLANAPDEKLLKVVSLVDRLANPEIHRRLLGPALPRLKLLRPPRPASLKRILLLPLSGALTNDAQWRRTRAQIPRSAIGPLMEVVGGALGAEADAVRQHLRGVMLDNASEVERVGRQVWQLAAEISPDMRRPGIRLSAAGLSAEDFEVIIDLATGLWRHAGPIWEGIKAIREGSQPHVLRAALIGPAEESRQLFAAALSTLMMNAPHPSIFVPLIKTNPIPNAAVIEDMLHRWVGAACREVAEAELEAGLRLAEQILMVMEELESVPRRQSSLATTEFMTHRRKLDEFFRGNYREIVSVHVLEGLLHLQKDEVEFLAEIEAMARSARSLEETGLRVATSQSYAVVKEEFRTRMEKALKSSSPPAISATEVARIEEILHRPIATKPVARPTPARPLVPKRGSRLMKRR